MTNLIKNKCIKFIFIFLLSMNGQNAFSQTYLKYKITGVTKEEEHNIRLRLAAIQTNKSLSSTAAFHLFHQGPLEVKKGLEPYGYFKSSVTSHLFKNKNNWQAQYHVTLGEPLRITSLDMKVTGAGAENSAIKNFMATKSLTVGDIFTVPVYDKFKIKLFSIAQNQGYLHAFFQNHILADLLRYTCRVSIQLVTGQQFYFGKVTFKNFPYSEKFLQRFIRIREGEAFSSKKILDLQRKMEKSYYFKSVVFKPNFNKTKNNKVPLDVYLTPPAKQAYTFGMGYGTLTGPRVSGGISLRHLGNEGHHLEAELKLSKILSGAGVTYYIPGCDPLTEEWLVGTNYKSFHPKSGRSNSVTVLGGYSKKLDVAQTIVSLNYLTDSFEIHRKPPARRSHELYPSVKLSYVQADNMANPHNAHSLNLTLQASPGLISTTNFAGFQSRIKWFISPFEFSRLIFRGDFGAIAIHNLPVYPMALRYFAGGVNSIRGFADSSIGPGRFLMVGSGEYQQQIKGNLFIATFYDIGFAASNFHARRNRGAGMGFVYYTQVGPVKLYFAQALSKHTHPKSIEFSIGPEFS